MVHGLQPALVNLSGSSITHYDVVVVGAPGAFSISRHLEYLMHSGSTVAFFILCVIVSFDPSVSADSVLPKRGLTIVWFCLVSL